MVLPLASNTIPKNCWEVEKNRSAFRRKTEVQTKHIAQGMRLPCVSGCSLTDYSIVNFSGSIFNGTFFKIPSCSKTLFEVYCS